MATAKAGAAVRRLGKEAVVIGGSIGGLLAARVLSDYFDRVTVVERDPIPETPEPRKGIPQGRHVHALFGGGVRVIKRLYPKFFDELVADGAVVCDFARDLCWYHQGVWKLRTDSDLTSYWQSRPFLEAHVRRRTRSDRDITFLDRCEVIELRSNAEKNRIVGVEVQHRDEGGRTESLDADLVVDAGGRGSRTPQWLEALGYARPDESTVEVNIGYASRLYERPEENTRDWQILAAFATPPNSTRSGYIFPIEGRRWLVSCVGHLQDYPPDGEEGFLEFARALEVSDLFEAIKDARPLSPIAAFRFPVQRWRRYERLGRLPEGLVVLGDAVCSFNPIYGQGMSACALQVDLLDRMLRQAGPNLSRQFAKRFFRRAAKIIANPWFLATTSDFSYPQTRGKRPFGTKITNWYVGRLFELCAWNRSILLRVYRVLHFIDRPAALFHPHAVFHVLTLALGFRRRNERGIPRPRRSLTTASAVNPQLIDEGQNSL
jgi:2-polyprenyl-6-methoxyphenol hydroxylase-like FAD-dependent oxidoreductase